MGRKLTDASLRRTHALPNGANTTSGQPLELGPRSALGRFAAECEAVVHAPALTTGELANGETIAYSLYHDSDPSFGGETLLAPIGVQTGAGGAGAPAAEYRTGIPAEAARYLRLKTIKTGEGNASPKSATLELAF